MRMKPVIPTSVIQGNLPLSMGGSSLGRLFFVSQTRGFHFPPLKKGRRDGVLGVLPCLMTEALGMNLGIPKGKSLRRTENQPAFHTGWTKIHSRTKYTHTKVSHGVLGGAGLCPL